MPAAAVSRLVVAVPARFDFAACLRFLEPRCTAGVDAVLDSTYVRSVRLKGVPAVVRIERADGALRVSATAGASRAAVRRLVRRMFDLDADGAAFRRMAARDPVLRRVVGQVPDVRVLQFADPFEGAIRAVLGQQVSVRGASTLAGRLVARLGMPGPSLDGRAFRLFPTPEALTAAGPAKLGRIGLPAARARALHAVAEATLDGRLPWEALRARPSADTHRALLAIPGIGPWTASYLQMRVLGDADACPVGDLGLVRALQAAHPRTRLTPARVAAIVARWSPWRAYGTVCLWTAGAGNAETGVGHGGRHTA